MGRDIRDSVFILYLIRGSERSKFKGVVGLCMVCVVVV